jgi:hypothetical protein
MVRPKECDQERCPVMQPLIFLFFSFSLFFCLPTRILGASLGVHGPQLCPCGLPALARRLGGAF